MPGHGTASSELNQFANVLAPVTVALAAALDGVDLKEAIRKAEEGQKLRSHLRSFFAEDQPQQITVPIHDFPAWKTIRIGQHNDLAALQAALNEAGCNISQWATDIMGKPEFVLSQKERDVELVRASGAELGFSKGYTLEELTERADQFNLDPCQPEDGPNLRLQYLDQPKGEWVRMAMKPITDSDGGLFVFFVGRHGHGGLWLLASCFLPGGLWPPDDVWVLRRRK